MQRIFDRYKVIDVDTHVTEPPDVWVSRVSKKWGDRVPHIVRMGKQDWWMIGDKPVLPPGITATLEAIKQQGGLINTLELQNLSQENVQTTNSSNGNLFRYLAKNLEMEIDWGKDYRGYSPGNLLKITLSL